jgi:hypothetical protein
MARAALKKVFRVFREILSKKILYSPKQSSENYFKDALMKKYFVGVWLSLARALPWGGRGRWFKSSHTDHQKLLTYPGGLFIFPYKTPSLSHLCRSLHSAIFLNPKNPTFILIFALEVTQRSRNFPCGSKTPGILWRIVHHA